MIFTWLFVKIESGLDNFQFNVVTLQRVLVLTPYSASKSALLCAEVLHARVKFTDWIESLSLDSKQQNKFKASHRTPAG